MRGNFQVEPYSENQLRSRGLQSPKLNTDLGKIRQSGEPSGTTSPRSVAFFESYIVIISQQIMLKFSGLIKFRKLLLKIIN